MEAGHDGSDIFIYQNNSNSFCYSLGNTLFVAWNPDFDRTGIWIF